MNTNNATYHLVCGLEIHAELKTASKMFCGCKNDPFHAPQPNIYTCPVCLGMPGALPVANKKAIEWTIKLGLALNCQINLFSKFDRKHYFYPDLPKGYQISQYDIPFCHDGVIESSSGPVRIRRIHLEEDTGKLLHKTINGEKVTLVDFNRSSVPLIEIVTEPDIHSPEQAKEYGKAIRQILRYLDIADCDMEQGGMRLEANISLQADGVEELPKYKVEVKNINSFRFLEQAIGFEIQRQGLELMDDRTPKQETRGWDSTHNTTFPQRSKEDAEDYRYFPDPDLPPIRFEQSFIDSLKAELLELPMAKVARWTTEFGIEAKYGRLLIEDIRLIERLEPLFKELQTQKLDSNKFANLVVNKKLVIDSNTQLHEVIGLFSELTKVDQVDAGELSSIVGQVIAENPAEVTAFKAGKEQLLNFFLGQVRKKLGKKVDVTIIKDELRHQLSS
jgi:aspartyl-tRNA(Asn)/glutamyl-tRNA(Gln) amidotransferase subunit B